MTFLELLLLIEERGEKVLGAELNAMFTQQHRYLRELDTSDSSWKEDTEPGRPEKRWGRGGEYYIWKRDEAPDDKPAQFPEGT